MSPPHPDHTDRDTKGRFLSPADQVDGSNPDEPDQDLPPQHPITGRFMADRHAVHPDRNVNGEFIDEDAYDD